MLKRKLLRDMKRNKTQFLSIFLMAFLGVFIFTGMNAEWMGMQHTLDNYMKQTNFADMWVVGNDFSEDDVMKVKTIDNINGVERRLVLDATVDMENNPTIRMNFAENTSISSCYTVEGEDFSTDKEGIWISEFFAKERKLAVGDSLTLSYSGMTWTEKIKGIIMNPEYIYMVKSSSQLLPDNYDFGFAFLSKDEFPAGIPISYNQLIVDTKENGDLIALENDITNILGNKSTVVLNRKAQMSYVTFQSEIESNRSMGNLLPIVFLLISVLAIITTMTRITAKQRTQIGTLKALGFRDSKITLHYLSYGIWIFVVGSVLGVILGPFIIPNILYKLMEGYYSLPVLKAYLSPTILLMVVASVTISALACYFACRKELSDPPAETLKPRGPKVMKFSRFETSKLWRKLGFSTHWNYRDAMRNKIRTLMGIVSVASCMTLLLCSFACKDSIKYLSDWSFQDLMLYESKIILSKTAEKGEIDKITLQYDGQQIEEKPIEIMVGDKKKTGSLTVLGDGNFMNYQNKKGESIKIKDSNIALSYKMAELLKVELGDKIKWHIYGDNNWQTVSLNQLYETPTNQGITMKVKTFEDMGYIFEASSILTSDLIDTNYTTNDIASIQNKSEIIKSINKQLEFIDTIMAILITGAIILGAVMIYNLGIISINEKNREIAVLKVIGFKVNKIRSLLQKQNIWITSIGIILGVPIGLSLAQYLLTLVGDVWDLRMNITLLSLLIAVGGTFILSYLVNSFLSRRVKTIDMVESLKGLE